VSAKDLALILVHHAVTPFWVQISAWQLLSILPLSSWDFSKRCLDKALLICDRMLGDEQRVKDENARYRAHTVSRVSLRVSLVALLYTAGHLSSFNFAPIFRS